MRACILVVLLVVSCSFLTGCATTATISAAEMGSYSPPADRPAEATLSESLFKEDQAVMDGKDLERILTAKITLPPDAKLAVVRFGRLPYWWGWSDDFARMNRQIDDDFLNTLRAGKSVRQVAYLPSLVTPTQMTIPYLRQAAARFQADLLLVYRTTTRNYDRQKAFTKDETKSYCTVEAILLDTRTGIVPFSTVVTEDFSAKRNKDDLDFSETIARVQQQAIAKAWVEVARQTTAFLDSQAATAATVPANK